MQSERTAEASALSGSVRGLGVCDALRLELLPEQLPQLVEQVEALRRACDGYELHLANLLYDALAGAGHVVAVRVHRPDAHHA